MTTELITRYFRALSVLWIPPLGPFDVAKLADLLCPPFLIMLSSAAIVHIGGLAPSGLRSIRHVREQPTGVIRVGDTW